MRIAFIYESGFAGNNGSNHLLCTTIEKMLQRGHSVDLIEAVSVRDNPDYPPQLAQHNFQCHTIELKETKKTNFIGRYLYGLSFVRESTKLAKDLDVVLVPYECAEGMDHTKELIQSIKPGQSVGMFIGPEGGFDPDEIALACETGGQVITLGKRILRTETAGLALLSVLMFQLEQVTY